MLATKRSPTRQLGAIDARTRPLLIPRYKTMINLLSLALAVAFLTTVPFSTSGFSCSSMILAANRRLVDRCLTTTFYHPPVFDRAVECVSNYGLCDLDELVELSAGRLVQRRLYLIIHTSISANHRPMTHDHDDWNYRVGEISRMLLRRWTRSLRERN